mmetsp:Transcript_13355/g.29455  ORF Transcript_13355/g.29455 Transcript_13355/m.29455 type:complete len:117 (+) Transcript_13355:934-1284(+)
MRELLRGKKERCTLCGKTVQKYVRFSYIKSICSQYFDLMISIISLLIFCNYSAGSANEFYSLFYLGLYNESVVGDLTKASYYMRAAAASKYSNGPGGAGDYMTSVAKVHCDLRGWI